jgi:hypothetical protein
LPVHSIPTGDAKPAAGYEVFFRTGLVVCSANLTAIPDVGVRSSEELQERASAGLKKIRLQWANPEPPEPQTVFFFMLQYNASAPAEATNATTSAANGSSTGASAFGGGMSVQVRFAVRGGQCFFLRLRCSPCVQIWHNGTEAATPSNSSNSSSTSNTAHTSSPHGSILCSPSTCTWELHRPEALALHHFSLRVFKRVSFSEGRPLLTSRLFSHPHLFANAGPFPGCVLSPANYSRAATFSITEGAALEYSVHLRLPPAANASVSISGGGPFLRSAAPDPSAVALFTPVDWNASQVVGLVSDRDYEHVGNRTYTVVHSISSADPNVDGKTCELVVNVTNDWSSALLVSVQEASVREGEGVLSYFVSLTQRPFSNVTVRVSAPPGKFNFSSTDGSQLIDSILLYFDSANFAVEQQVNATSVLDGLGGEYNQTSTITHTCSSPDDSRYDGLQKNLTAFVLNADGGVMLSTTQVIVREGASGIYRMRLFSQPYSDVQISVLSFNRLVLHGCLHPPQQQYCSRPLLC